MLPRSRPSIVGGVLFSLLALHCGGKHDGGSQIGNGGSGAGSGGGPSLGGAFGFNFGGLGGDLFGEGGVAGEGGPDGGVVIEGCGDGIVQAGEACDDGNSVSGDGCSASCGALEQDFACPSPGEACVTTVACGDGQVTGNELCDDGNRAGDDGCRSNCRAVDPGWSCLVPGLRCEASACGDGRVAGFEECDFAASTAGCTDCKIDDGYDCDDVDCHPVVCGDDYVERGEQCEDGNARPFDGCFNCRLEPVCSDGVCLSACGDGQRFEDEECDDGNSKNGDGCSFTCKIETGFACTPELATPPESLALPIIFRDFIGEGNSLVPTSGCYNPVSASPSVDKPIPCFHIDFNGLGGSGIQNMVESDLGGDGRPVYSCPEGDCDDNPGHLFTSGSRPNLNGPEPFAEWYDSSSPNAQQVLQSLTLARNEAQGTYVFDATGAGFYPLDEDGWVALGQEKLARLESEVDPGDPFCEHNVSFTSETHFWFEYQGGELFEFAGDDDLWVFVNGKLALDLGGLHVSQTARFLLDADTDGDGPDTADGHADVTGHYANPGLDLALNVGGVYEIVLFHAERNECGSNFKVTLKDFNKPKSVCASTCGDGAVASNELCDDGPGGNDGQYGNCGVDCRSRGPYCGDGTPQTAQGEACDDGQNLSGYGTGCAPGCQLPARCGDGEINAVFGERCDDGVNDGSYGGCTAECQLAPRCGDGQRQPNEACDDGNRLSGDGCSSNCTDEQPR